MAGKLRPFLPAQIPGIESERKCEVNAVDPDVRAGRWVLVFEDGCAENFDIQMLRGLRWPTLGLQDKTLDGILIAPPAMWQPGAVLRSFDREDTGR